MADKPKKKFQQHNVTKQQSTPSQVSAENKNAKIAQNITDNQPAHKQPPKNMRHATVNTGEAPMKKGQTGSPPGKSGGSSLSGPGTTMGSLKAGGDSGGSSGGGGGGSKGGGGGGGSGLNTGGKGGPGLGKWSGPNRRGIEVSQQRVFSPGAIRASAQARAKAGLAPLAEGGGTKPKLSTSSVSEFITGLGGK